MWHSVSSDEVKRIFVHNPMGFHRLTVGQKVSSPLGTGVIYRCVNPAVVEDDRVSEVE